ncbi:uncharacterized protein Z518_11019 [Rhinocladiella mackenziei CBS 650.93]|uniref:AMP-binding enzyme C-terminal domain-containing protein n=1 Tax=Rhinocladiella mackenziei CBS 650.93 TaxID=1442369 RepID=A0A0D2FBX4_9EURO|nr:uncharacterized protein Z518_11019 [Rhinocladiella mackenziei CBS 650.93]KIW99606.1 hypothetical protein Z518_11019 [Rhinocladiella mackenziei CBS 650.93]
MAKHPSVRDRDFDTSSVRRVLSGTALLGVEATQQFEELWNGRIKSPTGMGDVRRAPRESSGPSSISIGELVPDGGEKLIKEDSERETRLLNEELIKIRNAQVTPAGLEGFLLEHPQIVDAAMIGIKAYVSLDPWTHVELAPGLRMTKAKFAEIADMRVPKIKRLTGGVIFVVSIPKNPARF